MQQEGGPTKLRFFGEMSVMSDIERPVTANRQRAVLARLALQPSHTVATDRLISDVWVDAPSTSARSLAFQISKLRDLCEPDRDGPGSVILTEQVGYRLNLDAHQTDIGAFEHLIVDARREASNDSVKAYGLIEDALGLWRGAPFTGLTGYSWIDDETERLRGLRHQAQSLAAKLLIDLGEPDEACRRLDSLIASQPLDEELVDHQMRALSQLGRRVQALAAYSALRLRLSTELGIEPSRHLQDHELRLLSAAPEAEVSAPGNETTGSDVKHSQPRQGNRRLSLPARLQRHNELPMAGRAQELGVLQSALDAATAGSPRMVMLAGEPGIGKTRLCNEIATSAHAEGATVLLGRCDEDHGIAYQAWIDMVQHVIDDGPADLVGELAAEHGAELSLLCPALRRRFPEIPAVQSTEPETERYRLVQAVIKLVQSVSAATPLVLVLDDLQWADKQTLTMLRQVFAGLDASPVLIVGTLRDADLGVDDPLSNVLAALRREPGFEQLMVSGLDDGEMNELVTISAAGQPISAEAAKFVRQLQGETAGNPFYAHEILRHVVEAGDVYLSDTNVWMARSNVEQLTLPQSIRDLVGQRVARQGKDALSVMRTAAMIGSDFDLRVLAELTDGDEDEVLSLLENAIGARILAEVPEHNGRFRFGHSITRSALIAGISQGRRQRMHRDIAEVLEAQLDTRTPERVAELATHWLAAVAPANAAKAIQYTRQAGQQASLSLAPDEAIRWFSAALELTSAVEDDHLHVATMVELGTAQRDAGSPLHRETLLRAGTLAGAIGATDLEVAAALANNRGIYSKLGAIDAERIGALEAALQSTRTTSIRERTLLMATLFSELEYAAPYNERIGFIDEAIGLARSLGDSTILSSVLNRFCITSAVPHNLAARLEASSESLALARDLGDRSLEFWALSGSCLAGLGAGDLDRVVSCLDGMDQISADTGRPSFQWVTTNLRCSLTSALGDNDELESLANHSLALGTEASEPDAFDFFMVLIMTARRAQGRAGEIVEQLFDIGVANPSIEAYTAVAAMFMAREGLPERAQALLDAAKDRNFEVDLSNSWAATTCSWAQAASELEDVDACAVLYRLLSPHAGQISCHMTFCDASIDGVLGHLAVVLDQPEAAEAHFAASELTTSALGARFFGANDDLARAHLHRRLGNHQLASSYLDRTIEVAQNNGYKSVERRARLME